MNLSRSQNLYMPNTAIISELSQISQLVAGIPSATPYTIPAGYFQSLADHILYRITVIEPLEIDPSFIQLNKEKYTPYQVPSGYFNHVAGTILDHIKASEALTSNQEMDMLSPLLSRIGKKMPFSVPANYFKQLALPAVTDLNRSEMTDEEAQTPPFLQSVRTAPTYQLPAGYLSHLPATILKKVKTTGQAKVVSVSFSGKLARYAVAASVAGVIAVSGWFYVHKQPVSNSTSPELAEIKKLSSKELQDFVDRNTVILPEENTLVSADMKPEDIHVMFAGVSDEELQQYVDQQPMLKDPTIADFN